MVGSKPSPRSRAETPDEYLAIETLSRKARDSLSLRQKHKFWETQPVGQFKDIQNHDLSEGPIDDCTDLTEVRKQPYNLPSPYEWCTCEINKEETSTEI